MKRAAPENAPVLLKFAPELARADAWGRVTELSSTAACLSTQTPLSRREKVWLTFDFAGERWREVPAVVVWAEFDADGYCAVELRLTDIVVGHRLAKALADAIAR